jgi:hypothetical protein
MSIAAVSSNLINQQQASYFQTRSSDLKELGSALASGNLKEAQAAFNNIEALGKSGPFGGKSFKIAEREQDFTGIGKALQAGDLARAQQVFGALSASFESPHPVSSSNPEAVLKVSGGSGSSAAEGGSSSGPANGGISVSA